MGTIEYHRTPRQEAFMRASAFEVLFGGAAGGGKSHGQLLDAMFYAIRYPGSHQLILRRTFAELDKSLIRKTMELYPKGLYQYNSSSHVLRWKNESVIDFGYCANEKDVYQYQSAEYDVIRFDELTHFTEYQYTYLISRCRGTNGFPKQIKSSTNPGGVGHAWVKKRFIDPAPPNTEWMTENKTTRIFLPSRIKDNTYMMKTDPGYIQRLDHLPELQRRALLEGDWNIFEGQYFPEWNENVHVIKPIPLDPAWRRFRAFDYGLDCFACLWIAVSSDRHVYVYREFCKKDLTISAASNCAITETGTGEEIYCTYAPPDMWGRTQDTGRCKADLFQEYGLRLTKSSNDRETGFMSIKELLKTDANGDPHLHVFNTCRELIKYLPMHQIDPNKPNDCMTEPHEITHVVDALRYFTVSWARPATVEESAPTATWTADMWQDYNNARSQSEREYILKKYGRPK